MKYIILSDIHGNIYALQECMKYIEKMKFDAMIWLGDYITDIPKSHEVIQYIKECTNKYKCYIIRGNREKYILEYHNHQHKDWKVNTRQANIVYTYEELTKQDIEWIEKLPETIEIKSEDGNIYVSHKLEEKINKNYQYKLFGHIHNQHNYLKDGVRYINPGSVGITTDEIQKAQFAILEITKKYCKIEEYNVNYDINSAIDEIRKSKIYSDDYQWGKIIEVTLLTGKDYIYNCVTKYHELKEKTKVEEESIELWKKAMQIIIES